MLLQSRIDGQLWAESMYVIAIHGMFKINYQMGKHHMNGVLKTSSVGLSFFFGAKVQTCFGVRSTCGRMLGVRPTRSRR